jgi:hypothetical protein
MSDDNGKTRPATKAPNRKPSPPSGIAVLTPLALAALENGVAPEDVAAYLAGRTSR